MPHSTHERSSSSASSTGATCCSMDIQEIQRDRFTPDPDWFGTAPSPSIEGSSADVGSSADESALSDLHESETSEVMRAESGIPAPSNQVSHSRLDEQTAPNEAQSNNTPNTSRSAGPGLRPQNTQNNQVNGNSDSSGPGFGDGLPGSARNTSPHDDQGQGPSNTPNGQANGRSRPEQRFQLNDIQNTPSYTVPLGPGTTLDSQVSGNDGLASHTTNSVSRDESSSGNSEE